MSKEICENAFSLGIGSTANCNLNCGHCYSRHLRGHSLSFEQFKEIVDGGNKRVSSVNFGTGENILNRDFPKMIEWCYDKGIKMSVTSNGSTINQMTNEQLQMFNDVDISLDFPSQEYQDRFRNLLGKGPSQDSWSWVNTAIEKCKKLDVEFSITTALMNTNYRDAPGLLEKAAEEGCNLRVNIFKPVPKSGIWKYQLNYDEFWEGMELLFSNGNLISCSEPIVNAMLNIPPIVPQSPCGLESLRIHPDGEVMPCVYWVNGDNDGFLRNKKGDIVEIPGKGAMKGYWTRGNVSIEDLTESFEPAFENEGFKRIRAIPEYCQDECDKVDVCGGGCASRRYLNGKLDEPDIYCPTYKGREIPDIKVTKSKSAKDLVHSSYLCTLIFEGRK